MPYLNQIVAALNRELRQVTSLQGRYGGIAYQVQRELDTSQIWPALFEEGKVEQYIGLDDTDNAVIYHRILSNTYGRDKNYPNTYTSATQMVMIVYVRRGATKLTPDQAEALIISGIPQTITLTTQGLKHVSINVGNTNMNPLEVFPTEYRNVPYRLPADGILLSFRYTINAIFDKNCLSNCCGELQESISELCELIQNSSAEKILDCLSEAQLAEICQGAGPCDDCIVEIYLDAVLQSTTTVACGGSEVINVNWN
jgi:hypothetical protein